MKILIAEDQALPAHYLRRTLERLGHEVAVATDGLAAWDVLRREHVPLVISDWMMPGLDGLELCRRIRARGGLRYTYVILLTSRDRPTDKLEGLRAGADDFLVKPPDADELSVRLEVARRILGVQAELERLNARLEELATTDALTGACNRRRFDDELRTACAFAGRQGMPLSLALVDVDHFKSYNDAHGHPAGDVVLRQVAEVLRRQSRTHDLVARYGGEEFAVLLLGADAAAATIASGRLRAGLVAHPWPLRPVTASFGVATLGPDLPDGAALLEAADRALYHSKRQGRDRVTHHRDLAAVAVAV